MNAQEVIAFLKKYIVINNYIPASFDELVRNNALFLEKNAKTGLDLHV